MWLRGTVRRFRRWLRDTSRLIGWRFGLWAREIESRTDLLNFLVAVNGYRNYLEIGVRNPRRNFDRVRVPYKVGVDPAPEGPVTFRQSSDEFFARLSDSDRTADFDLILIDGLHLAEQVERDIANSLHHLAPNGTIVVHDCNPRSVDAQTTDYDGVRVWNGTVWQAWLKLRATRSDLAMFVVDVDYGCGLISRGRQERYPVVFTSYGDLDYGMLERDRQRILNLISPRDFRARSQAFVPRK
jgi:Methyltransferase domain